MRPVIVIASAAIGAMVFVGALWSFQQATTPSIGAPAKLTSVSLRLNGSFAPKYAGEMVAARTGLFDREGLQIELKPGGNGADSISSVASGADTFGVARGIDFLVARAKGAPIVAFAAGYLESDVVFYVLERSGIHTVQDFIGKRVGYQPGQDTAIIYDALLANLGIGRSKIREIITGTDIAALLNNDVDIWPGHVAEEAYILKQKGIDFNVVRPLNFGIHVPGTVYFTTEKIIRDHPSLVQKFLRAVIAGWTLTYADYSKSVPLISAYDEKALTPERVRFALGEQRDFVFPLGRRFAEFDDRQWKLLRIILLNERLIDDSVDMSKAVTYEFLREAYRKSIQFGK